MIHDYVLYDNLTPLILITYSLFVVPYLFPFHYCFYTNFMDTESIFSVMHIYWKKLESYKKQIAARATATQVL